LYIVEVRGRAGATDPIHVAENRVGNNHLSRVKFAIGQSGDGRANKHHIVSALAAAFEYREVASASATSIMSNYGQRGVAPSARLSQCWVKAIIGGGSNG